MTLSVVDTNVARVANGRDTHADVECQLACIDRLEAIVSEGKIALDDGGLILEEYSNKLSLAGAPGVGDMFYRHAFNNQYVDGRCVRVVIDPASDAEGTFAQFPTNLAHDGFDRSDRKFVAVALAAPEEAIIYNAVDTDWSYHRAGLIAAGVVVHELCPHHV